MRSSCIAFQPTSSVSFCGGRWGGCSLGYTRTVMTVRDQILGTQGQTIWGTQVSSIDCFLRRCSFSSQASFEFLHNGTLQYNSCFRWGKTAQEFLDLLSHKSTPACRCYSLLHKKVIFHPMQAHALPHLLLIPPASLRKLSRLALFQSTGSELPSRSEGFEFSGFELWNTCTTSPEKWIIRELVWYD